MEQKFRITPEIFITEKSEQIKKLLGKKITQDVLNRHVRQFYHSLMANQQRFRNLIPPPFAFIPYTPYICPLCMENHIFIFHNGAAKISSEFTLDHVPPDVVGGTFKIMTCKACNNNAGNYEGEFKKLIDLVSLGEKKTDTIISTEVTVIETNKTLKTKFRITEQGNPSFYFEENVKKHNKEVKQFLEELHAGKHKKLKIFIPGYDVLKMQKACLKSAYLICFQNWGYEFAYSKNAELIRKVLKGEIEYPLETPLIFVDRKKFDMPIGVGIISEPLEIQCYYVNMKINIGIDERWASVFIPNPTSIGWDQLKKVQELMKSPNKPKEFTFYTLQQTIPDELTGYTDQWNKFLSDQEAGTLEN